MEYEFDIDGLTHLPWVGQNYENTKLLIVGESLYTDDDHKKEYEENPEKLREIIKENAIQNEVKMFRNLNRTLMGCDGLYNTQALWDNVAYCEFVQRIMDYSKYAVQPDKEDFEKGAKVFKQIIKILEPDYCLFLGVRAIDFLGGEKIDSAKNNVRPRFLNHGDKTPCIAIKHPSAFFTPKEWGKYIARKSGICDVISNLRESASIDKFVNGIISNSKNLVWHRDVAYLTYRESINEECDLYAEWDFNMMEMSYGFVVKEKKESNEVEKQEKLYQQFIDHYEDIETKFKYCGYSDGWLMFNDETFSYSGLKEQWEAIYNKLNEATKNK